MNKILEIKNLEKSYHNKKTAKKVIHGLDFQVYEGEILCILGPNGAGKSTTINILTGALGYESGDILYKNKPLSRRRRTFKKHLGIVPQDLALYEDLSAWQNVIFFASLYGLKGEQLKNCCLEALRFVGLSDKADDKVGTFSGGMKRRLNIACAIAHQPEIVIMDEPTVGIDPQSRNHILTSIKDLRKRGMTIIYTTHYMEEVEEISTRIIIMDQGKLIANGTKELLKEKIDEDKIFHIEIADTEASFQPEELYKIEGVKHVNFTDSQLEIVVLKGIENLDRIIGRLIEQGAKINGITCQVPSLETVFLKMTGKSLRD